MKVYYHGHGLKHRLFVQPGVDYPETSEWMEPTDPKGNVKPKLLEIQFENGVANVSDNLGRYLIEKGHARKSKIILPTEVAQ